jgi:hypothetical protein
MVHPVYNIWVIPFFFLVVTLVFFCPVELFWNCDSDYMVVLWDSDVLMGWDLLQFAC